MEFSIVIRTYTLRLLAGPSHICPTYRTETSGIMKVGAELAILSILYMDHLAECNLSLRRRHMSIPSVVKYSCKSKDNMKKGLAQIVFILDFRQLMSRLE